MIGLGNIVVNFISAWRIYLPSRVVRFTLQRTYIVHFFNCNKMQ